MSSDKVKSQPRQGPPVAFRPGPDLEQLLRAFADGHKLVLNEACKSLVALAVTAMDVRYYGLVHQLAEAMGGTNAFVRACLHVQGRVEGAALADRAFMAEPERSLLILRVVREFVEGKGRQLPDLDLSFLPEQSAHHAGVQEPPTSRKKTSTARPKPSINKKVRQKESTHGEQAGSREGEMDEAQGWSSIDRPEGEQERARP